jgi:hypothetical protein
MSPLLSSLMQQAAYHYETPLFNRKSTATFLAIKGCEQTKIGKVINLVQTSL